MARARRYLRLIAGKHLSRLELQISNTCMRAPGKILGVLVHITPQDYGCPSSSIAGKQPLRLE